MLQNDCPRWMAPITLVAGFIGLILALLGGNDIGLDWRGGAVVFPVLFFVVVILSLVFCVISAFAALRKAMTTLESLIRAACSVAVPGFMGLLVVFAALASNSGYKAITTLSLVYTLVFVAALAAFWWYHVIPFVDYAAEIMAVVMICTNYKMAVDMGVGALWLHRIVCLLALVAFVWGACRFIADDEPVMGLVGLVAPLVGGIIWMVFEATNRTASATWMLIPIAIALLGTFLVCAKIYGFLDALFGGGSSGSSSGGPSIPGKKGDVPDPDGSKAWKYVNKDLFDRDDWRWHVKISIKGKTITVKGTLWVDRKTFLNEPENFMSVNELRQYSIDLVEGGLKYYYSVYNGPAFRVRSGVTYKTVSL